MNRQRQGPALCDDPAVLGRIMPMYLWLEHGGRIVGAGPTLRKLWGAQAGIGADFDTVFTLRCPRRVQALAELAALPGGRVKLCLKAPPHTGFKGVAVTLGTGQGVFLNLSLGIAVADAVRDHGLTQSDFAATDLTVELLYLIEAKTAVEKALNKLTERLNSAKSTAEEQALTDTLTGLRNRRAMDRDLARLAAADTPFAMLHVDLDYFKQVNDTLGHAAGDHVLMRVAQILTEETRRGDTVARVGGDEFVLLLPGVRSRAPVARVAERIIARLSEPIMFEGKPCRIAASIGATLSLDYDTPDADTMLMHADRALYASKRDGRGRLTTADPASASARDRRAAEGGGPWKP